MSRDAIALHHGDSAYWAGCDDGSTPADRTVALADGVIRRLDGELGGRMLSVMGYREVFPGPLRARVPPDVFVWLMGGGYLGVRLDDAVSRWRSAGARHLGWYAYWNIGPSRLPLDDGLFAVRARAAEVQRRALGGFEALGAEQDGSFGVGGWWKWLLMDIARDPGGGDAAVDRRIDDLVTRAFPARARAAIRRFLLRFDASDARILLSAQWVDEAYAELREARTAVGRADRGALGRIEDLLVVTRFIELSLDARAGTPGAEDAVRELLACTADRGILDERVRRDAPACAPLPFDAWLRRPRPEPIRWWPGRDDGRYARATRFPGDADAGGDGAPVRGLPREADLWRIWADPSAGIVLRSTCHGVDDQSGPPPEAAHMTSRLLGRLELSLTRDGEAACTAQLPPDRQARDVALGSAAAAAASAAPGGTTCRGAPRELPLDTGAPEPPAVACDAQVLEQRGAGVYTLHSDGHRTGLDLRAIEGGAGAPIGVSRWESPFGPSEDRLPDEGAAARYFYVPLGQRSITVYSSGQPCAVVRDGDPAHRVSLGGRRPGYHVIDTLGHDGEIWALAACRGVYLVDVPPVVAPRREQLLVPCSLVEDKARRADVERLGVDPADCTTR